MNVIRKYTVRFPEELQIVLKEDAKKESRSLHLHILHILQEWIKNKKAAAQFGHSSAALKKNVTKGNQS